MIEARGLYKTYVMGRVALSVLKGVSLRVEPGAFVAITGPSGAGKSTLLHLLAALDTPTSGDVFWDGKSVSSLSDAKRSEFRNRTIGIVFQFYHLLPELSALENVIMPGLVGGNRCVKALKGRAQTCLRRVGLGERMRHRSRELSGGEQQRVAIARALVNEPKLLLCDEPTGNLDSQTGAEIADLLMDVQRQEGMSLVLVTHELDLAARAKKHIVLRDGHIVEELSKKGL
jgi:lipoprotein-releasing system ATP-binding protein